MRNQHRIANPPCKTAPRPSSGTRTQPSGRASAQQPPGPADAVPLHRCHNDAAIAAAAQEEEDSRGRARTKGNALPTATLVAGGGGQTPSTGLAANHPATLAFRASQADGAKASQEVAAVLDQQQRVLAVQQTNESPHVHPGQKEPSCPGGPRHHCSSRTSCRGYRRHSGHSDASSNRTYQHRDLRGQQQRKRWPTASRHKLA